MQSNSLNTRLGDFEVVITYSRADMIADGEMIDVSETARLIGFRFPVGMTLSIWALCVEWTDADTERTGRVQDQEVRLWDLLDVLVRQLRGCTSHRIEFEFSHADRRGKKWAQSTTTVVAVCGPGDDAAPVITLMMPGED